MMVERSGRMSDHYRPSFLSSFIHQIHKDAFIRHLKQCNLLKDFQVADPESESYWKNRADLAFKYDLN